jgi:hypothetical protein
VGLLKGNTISGWLKTRQKVAFINDALQGKNTESIVVIQGTPGSLAVAGGADGCELAQGILKVSFARQLGQEFLTADSSNLPGDWGGAPDMCARFESYNYALNTDSLGSMQTVRVYAYAAPGGNINSVLGMEISVYERGSYAVSGYSSQTVRTLLVSQRCRSVVKTTTNLLVVDDRSDGSHSITTATGSAMIKIHGEGGASFGARATAIHFETAGDSTGWTHAFSFETRAGLEGYVGSLTAAHHGTILGYIKVKDVAGSATGYINVYSEAPE